MAAESRRTFDSVMGGISNALAFMNDPRLQASLVRTGEADFTLDVLCEKTSDPVFVFFVMPPEMTEQNAAVIRQFFSTLRTLKQQRPDAPTLNLVMDEAAQLGRFPEIAEFYSIGRGFGLCPVCVYQDIGQIRNNLGPTGAMTLSASADLEVYLGGGISDLETARHLSAKLGKLADKIDSALPSKGHLSEFIEPALQFLTNPWNLYKKGDFAMQQTVLRLTFAEPLRYSRNEGYRTAEITFPFKVLAEFSTPKCGMVGDPGIEPGVRLREGVTVPCHTLRPVAHCLR